jgi:hypothetical protein
MTNDEMDKAVRLLAIIYSTVNGDGSYIDERLPFTVAEDQVVHFSEPILAQLNLPENQDLIKWAHAHVQELF